LRKIKTRNLWIEKDGNRHVDVTASLKALENGDYKLNANADAEAVQALCDTPTFLFDGSTSDVVLADDANSDVVVTQDFAVEVRFKPTDVTRATDYLINKEAGGIGWGLFIDKDDIHIRFDDNTKDSTTIVATGVLTNNEWCHVIVSFDRVNGLASTYVNSVLQSTVDISLTALTLANAGALHIGNDSADASEFSGEMNLIRFWNKTLSASEALALTRGGKVPFVYKGANNTTHFLTAKDGTFAGGSTNWANGDLGTTFDETTDMSCVSSATGQYAKIPMSNLTACAINKAYKLTYKYTEVLAGFEWKMKGTVTQVLGDAVAGTTEHIEFVAIETFSSTDWLGVYSKTNAISSAHFDNLVLTSLGCVWELESNGIKGSVWEDSSGNDMDATSVATAQNMPKMIPYYIPAVQFALTTGQYGDINSTGTFGHGCTDGELVKCGYIPFECYGGIDVNKDLYVQVIWAGIDGTTGQGNTFIVLYDADVMGAGVLTAPATTLDTILVEDLEHDTPYVIQKTEKGVIAAGTLSEGSAIAWAIEADIVDDTADPGVWIIGLLISQ